MEDNIEIKKEKIEPNLDSNVKLTKGGVKKKTFVPKIPIKKKRDTNVELVAVKEEVKEIKPEPSAGKNLSRDRDRDNDRGRGRGRQQPVLTASGPFSMGPTGLNSGFGRKRAPAASSAPRVQSTSVKSEGNRVGLNIKDEDENIEIYEEDAEIILQYEDIKAMKEGKEKEPQELENEFAKLNFGEDIKTASEGTIENQNKNLMIFQLPYVLPKFKSEGETNSVGDNLESLQGKVGKLMVYKSGKVMMKYGDLLLDVSRAADCAFHQEVAAIDTDNSNICGLGSIKEKFVCVPNMDDLLSR